MGILKQYCLRPVNFNSCLFYTEMRAIAILFKDAA
jgi:hypothetical protein